MSIRQLSLSSTRILHCWVSITLLAFGGWAFAAPMTWTLQDVIFNDGGTAMGTFTYDAATDTFTNVAITTTPGTIRDGAMYTAALEILMAPEEELSFVTPPPPIQENITERLTIMLASPLTDAGGTIDIVSVTELTCLTGLGCSFVTGDEPGLDLRFDFPSAGFVTTMPAPPVEMPEPTMLGLLGLSLVVLGVARRRWRANSRAKTPPEARASDRRAGSRATAPAAATANHHRHCGPADVATN